LWANGIWSIPQNGQTEKPTHKKCCHVSIHVIISSLVKILSHGRLDKGQLSNF